MFIFESDITYICLNFLRFFFLPQKETFGGSMLLSRLKMTKEIKIKHVEPRNKIHVDRCNKRRKKKKKKNSKEISDATKMKEYWRWYKFRLGEARKNLQKRVEMSLRRKSTNGKISCNLFCACTQLPKNAFENNRKKV